MANDLQLLSSIVEFSIGLGGFSGIVAVFVQRTGDWTAVDRWRVTNLLAVTLTPAFAAFFAMGMARILVGEEIAWRSGSAFLALVLCLFHYFIPAGRRKLPTEQQHIVSPRAFAFMYGTTLVILAFQAAAAIGLFGSHVFVVFFYGLVTMLLVGALQFMRIILVRPK